MSKQFKLDADLRRARIFQTLALLAWLPFVAFTVPSEWVEQFLAYRSAHPWHATWVNFGSLAVLLLAGYFANRHANTYMRNQLKKLDEEEEARSVQAEKDLEKELRAKYPPGSVR